MAQIIYALAALVAVMLFTVSTHRATQTSEQQMYTTEVSTRLSGLARSTVERVSRSGLPFDEKTDPDRVSPGTDYPYVATAGNLTAADGFGGCTDMSACLDLDDFDGASFADSVFGIPINIDFTVVYVDTLTGAESASATFAKRLSASVSTEAIQILGEPLTVTYSRVFAYPSVLDFARGAASKL